MKTSALSAVNYQNTMPTTPNQSEPVDTSPDQSQAEQQPYTPPEKLLHTSANQSGRSHLRLVSGHAPDISDELPTEAEPVFETSPDQPGLGDTGFRKLNLSSASNDNTSRYLDVNAKGVTVTVSNMAEAEFVEFWAVDVYEIMSSAFMLFRFDISEIETDEDELEQARKAAKNLYRMAKRRPKMFGWMLSETTLEGADWMMCVGFFGGKVAALIAGIKERRLEKKRKALEKAQNEDTTTPFMPPKNKPVAEVSHA